ncbi:MAG: hypothetical protein C7B47_11390 [Sulfobacillus thermosulfidooxidans]|uniref:Uncharacterized protein n=1 Tax=Sulfobacillus thermosulfidooxidans TaxID=28034 RepID=A0A2T2WUA8_SULTH|nr:MAG: hypothetical protein C7B47_11390 [Sulfobacillus thermosulfidooxidans]
MKWMVRIAASLLTSIGLVWMVMMAFPHMNFTLGQGAAIVLTLGYMIWIASLITTGMYWAWKPETRTSEVAIHNVVAWPILRHDTKGPKAS